jgi:branched-chain amino acid transport system permease protein
VSGSLIVAAIALVVVAAVAWQARRDKFSLVEDYAASERQFRPNGRKWMMLVGAFLFVGIPVGSSWLGVGGLHLPNGFFPGTPFNEKWLLVGSLAGVYAIAAIGLNLLIGNTGQISLGHSAFIAIGAFSMAYFGHATQASREAGLMNFTVGGYRLHGALVLVITTIIGALIAAAIGPFALRLRGNYLAIVSLVLVLASQHIVKNWDSMTGGEGNPRTIPAPDFKIVPKSFLPEDVSGTIDLRADDGSASFFDSIFPNDKAAHFWTIWFLVVVIAVIARNLIRTRQGRAMMAVRDRDLSAEVIGVRQMYTKTWAFAVCGGLGALAGALYGSLLGLVNESSFNLIFSISFVVMIVVGGVGSVAGAIVGAVFYAFLRDILTHFDANLKKLPFIQENDAMAGLTVGRFIEIIYALLLILFLIYYPEGLMGMWRRTKRYLMTWPLGS